MLEHVAQRTSPEQSVLPNELVVERRQHVQDDQADEDRRQAEVRHPRRIVAKVGGSGSPELANTSPAARDNRRRISRSGHQDDQDVETIMQRPARGDWPRGLASQADDEADDHKARISMPRHVQRRTAIFSGSAFSIAARPKKPTAEPPGSARPAASAVSPIADDSATRLHAEASSRDFSRASTLRCQP